MGLLPRCVAEMSNRTYTSGVAPGVVPSRQQRGQFGNFGGPDGRQITQIRISTNFLFQLDHVTHARHSLLS